MNATPRTERIVFQDGRARFVHSDLLADLTADLGPVSITRASHVEPTDGGQWTADMAPVGGPVLGPFRYRADALAAEREYIRNYLGL